MKDAMLARIIGNDVVLLETEVSGHPVEVFAQGGRWYARIPHLHTTIVADTPEDALRNAEEYLRDTP